MNIREGDPVDASTNGDKDRRLESGIGPTSDDFMFDISRKKKKDDSSSSESSSSSEDSNATNIALEKISKSLEKRLDALITERLERQSCLPRNFTEDAVKFGSYRSSSQSTEGFDSFGLNWKKPVDLTKEDKGILNLLILFLFCMNFILFFSHRKILFIFLFLFSIFDP